MKNRVLCAATLVMCLSACVSLPTSQAAGVSYAATPSTWPTETGCLNPAKPRGIAKEIMVGSMMTVAIAGGDKSISDDDWRTFDPGFGNTKNSDRHLLFQRSCFSRSPSRASTCVGDDCREIVNVGGHSWVALSKIDAADCWPNASACVATGARDCRDKPQKSQRSGRMRRGRSKKRVSRRETRLSSGAHKWVLPTPSIRGSTIVPGLASRSS
jgi:hypothetical protein